MNRRLFNLGLCLVPFLRLPKMEKQECICMIMDGVPDREGDYLFSKDMKIPAGELHICRDHEQIIGKCQVSIKGDKLVLDSYDGPACEGYLSVKVLCNTRGKRFTNVSLISIGIGKIKNCDARIKPIKLSKFGRV